LATLRWCLGTFLEERERERERGGGKRRTVLC